VYVTLLRYSRVFAGEVGRVGYVVVAPRVVWYNDVMFRAGSSSVSIDVNERKQMLQRRRFQATYRGVEAKRQVESQCLRPKSPASCRLLVKVLRLQIFFTAVCAQTVRCAVYL
jgi:hypothetical protein